MDAAAGLTLAAAVPPLKEAGICAAAVLAAVAVLAPPPKLRAAAMLAALVLTPVLLVAEVWDTPQLSPLRDRPVFAAAGAAAGIVALVLAALLIRRVPAVFPIAAVATLPFRLPVESGGETANLLLPLYFVIGAGALAWAIDRFLNVEPPPRPRPGALEWLLAGAVVLYAAQAAYTTDFPKALQQVVFFYVPFLLLFGLLAQVRWDRRLLVVCLGVLAAEAVVFTAIGVVEFATRRLFLNPKVIASNQLESYFRVNSLFFDPNIFGRFLMLVALAVTAVMLWARQARVVIGCAVLLAVLWGGLVMTLSQSSLSALVVGLVVLGGLRWSVRWAAILAGGAVLAAAAIVLVAPGAVGVKDRSLDRATSGRADLVEGGVRLFTDKPVLGWGSGAFEPEFRRAEKVSNEQAASASHTIPITVAAEQGVIGLAVYLALLVAALWRTLRGARAGPATAAVGAMFVALVFHTWLYAAFLEDPAVWALLGVGTALAAAAARVRAGEPAWPGGNDLGPAVGAEEEEEAAAPAGGAAGGPDAPGAPGAPAPA